MTCILTFKANNKRYLYLHAIYQFWSLDNFQGIIVDSLTFVFWNPLLLLWSSLFLFCLSCNKSHRWRIFVKWHESYFIRRLYSLNCFVCAPVLSWRGKDCPFDAVCDYYNVPSMNESPRSHQILIKSIYLTLSQGNIENVIHTRSLWVLHGHIYGVRLYASHWLSSEGPFRFTNKSALTDHSTKEQRSSKTWEKNEDLSEQAISK